MGWRRRFCKEKLIEQEWNVDTDEPLYVTKIIKITGLDLHELKLIERMIDINVGNLR